MLLPHIDALASDAPPDTGTETTTYLLNQAGAFPGDHHSRADLGQALVQAVQQRRLRQCARSQISASGNGMTT